jgi:hypothetical protein
LILALPLLNIEKGRLKKNINQLAFKLFKKNIEPFPILALKP